RGIEADLMSKRGTKGGGAVAFGQVHLPTLIIPVGPFYIGWVLATERLLPTELDFFIALVSLLPVLGLGTVLLNDVYDTDVDALSARKGGYSSSTGRLPTRSLRLFGAASLLASVAIAMMVNLEFIAVVSLLVLVALMYSVPPVQLSRRPGLDIAANSFGIGVLCTIGGWVVASPGDLPPTVWLLTSALGTGTFFLLPTLMDYESDLEGGKRTIAVVLGWDSACLMGLALMTAADVGIVYMSLASVILNPGFLWVAVPIIIGELLVFPLLIRRRDLLKQLTAVMGFLLSIGNLVIVLSYLGLLGPF
ncbi:MAG: UbiA family prenyltransferase, partial [Candidatus Thermoplasmatota archaeon]|nr:UbiA family prenyltransferase [Candidatus Thermoplasmatota archaeon]